MKAKPIEPGCKAMLIPTDSCRSQYMGKTVWVIKFIGMPTSRRARQDPNFWAIEPIGFKSPSGCELVAHESNLMRIDPEETKEETKERELVTNE